MPTENPVSWHILVCPATPRHTRAAAPYVPCLCKVQVQMLQYRQHNCTKGTIANCCMLWLCSVLPSTFLRPTLRRARGNSVQPPNTLTPRAPCRGDSKLLITPAMQKHMLQVIDGMPITNKNCLPTQAVTKWPASTTRKWWCFVFTTHCAEHPSVHWPLSLVPDWLGHLALVARLTSEFMTWMPQCLLLCRILQALRPRTLCSKFDVDRLGIQETKTNLCA